MGGRLKKFRILLNLIKDKSSIIKATLSTTKPHISKLRISVVRATTHGGSTPPSDNRIDSVLSLGRQYDAGYSCVEALMSRLHRTKNASVALKSLFLLHIIITKGSFIIKNQLSLYLSNGSGSNFLNLSRFREEITDHERWSLVPWVRWYSGVLEHNIKVRGFLRKEEKVSGLLSKYLLGEIDVLIDFVEITSQFPDSLDLVKNDLVYEIVRLISDDYRAIQLEILIRVQEVRTRIPSLSYGELSRVGSELMRLESFKERFSLLFLNRNRNDGLWELVGETRKEIGEMIKENEERKLITTYGYRYENGYDLSGWIRFDEDG